MDSPAHGTPAHPSAAAEQARVRLHEEIERVRVGVEEMLAEQGEGNGELRRELEEIRKETRRYVKKRVRRSEKRIDKLERRLDQVEQDRQQAEWRIYTNTEQMLDGLLKEIRAIADLLTRAR